MYKKKKKDDDNALYPYEEFGDVLELEAPVYCLETGALLSWPGQDNEDGEESDIEASEEEDEDHP